MRQLDGRRILVVEDDGLVAQAVCQALSELGATIVGPAASVTAARDTAMNDEIDAALLDVDLGGHLVYPVADMLLDRGIPFVLATATPLYAMPPRYWHLPREDKPFCAVALAARIAAICAVTHEAPLPHFEAGRPAPMVPRIVG